MNEIPIPERMRHLPVYQGFVVHYTVFVGPDGVPDFRVIHEEHRIKCAKYGLCNLCGYQLDIPMVFIGSDPSVKHHHFVDGPMHEECALYATKVCPYLKKADYNQKDRPFRHKEDAGVVLMKIENVPIGRPARMALFYTTGYRIKVESGSMFFISDPPLKVVWDAMPARPNETNRGTTSPDGTVRDGDHHAVQGQAG